MKSDNEIRLMLGIPTLTPEQLEKRRKQRLGAMRPGHAVGKDNRLRPIPGAITGYDPETGRPTIAIPLRQREPLRKLCPVSIDALVETDGDVDEAEATVVEVGFRPESIPVVAGEDTEDDDLETTATEQAADAALAASHEVCAEGEDDDE